MFGEQSHLSPFDKNTGLRFFHLTWGFRLKSVAGDLVHLGEMFLVPTSRGSLGVFWRLGESLTKQTKAKTNGCSESVIH